MSSPLATRLRIREKPLWLRLWLPARRANIALFGTVYLLPGLRARLERDDPERLADILDHEAIHVARQKARGMIAWHLLYALSRGFRWKEEQAAYFSSLRRERDRGLRLPDADRERLARVLSGPAYLWMTTYERARRFIDAALAAP